MTTLVTRPRRPLTSKGTKLTNKILQITPKPEPPTPDNGYVLEAEETPHNTNQTKSTTTTNLFTTPKPFKMIPIHPFLGGNTTTGCETGPQKLLSTGSAKMGLEPATKSGTALEF